MKILQYEEWDGHYECAAGYGCYGVPRVYAKLCNDTTQCDEALGEECRDFDPVASLDGVVWGTCLP